MFAVTAARDKTVKIWDAVRGQCLHTLVGHDDWVRSIVFHPNGQFILTASDDHSFRVWDLKTGRCTRKIEAHERFVTSMTWGRQAVSQSGDKSDAPPPLVNVIATCSSDQVSYSCLPFSSLLMWIVDGQDLGADTMRTTITQPVVLSIGRGSTTTTFVNLDFMHWIFNL